MSDPQTAAASPILTLGDIYYVLFRHKWKIVICSLIGLSGAAALYKLQPPPYQSEAKLFIRYVMENRATAPGNDSRVTSTDPRGDTILNSELEIITSVDLAGEVVDRIGADKIGAPGNRDRAAAIVAGGLIAEVPTKSSIIHLVYKHSNPLIVQSVLAEIINCYEVKHKGIHRALGITGDFLTHETDQLRSSLAETEESLRKARAKIGVSSIEDAKKRLEGVAKIDQCARREILEARGTRELDGDCRGPLGVLGLALFDLDAAERQCAKHGLKVTRSLVGSYVTSLEMAGCSVTLTLLDAQMTALWDAPVHTAALRW